jgi:hypothetical protein
MGDAIHIRVAAATTLRQADVCNACSSRRVAHARIADCCLGKLDLIPNAGESTS